MSLVCWSHFSDEEMIGYSTQMSQFGLGSSVEHSQNSGFFSMLSPVLCRACMFSQCLCGVLHLSPVQTLAMHINLTWDFNLLLGVSVWQHRDALRGWLILEAVKRMAGTCWSPFSGWKQETNKAILLWGFQYLNLILHNLLSDKTSVNPLPPQAFYYTLEKKKKTFYSSFLFLSQHSRWELGRKSPV